jgi:branched-chain amino acid transport system substrate-binding protein
MMNCYPSFLLCLALVQLPLQAIAADTVKVALNVALSGSFANIGELYLKSSQFAIDAINARGGVLGGHKLELVPFDNKNSPQEALLALKQITDARIPFVVQGGGSHIAVPLSEAVERHNWRQPQNRLLFLDDPGDVELAQEKCSFWTFQFTPNAEAKMQALTTYIAAQRGVRRVYLINQDYVFGQQVRQFAREMLARKRPDIQIVGDDLHPFGKVKDFSPYVAKIKAAGADVVITGNWGNDMTLLIRAAAASGLNVQFYTYYAFGPGAPTAMGASAVDRVKAIWRWHPNLPIARERQAADSYKRRFHLEYYAMPLNNVFEMLAEAIERAGSTEALGVAHALEDMRLSGSMGEVWMRAEDHQVFEPLYLFTLTRVNGKGVRYDLEGSGLGTRTDARIDAKDLMIPTRCRMQRPSGPGASAESGRVT